MSKFSGRALSIVGLFLALMSPWVNAAELSISKSASVTTVPSGQQFDYILQYNCVSITEDCTGVTVTDVLDSDLDHASGNVTLVDSPHVLSNSYVSGTGTASWTFVDPLPAGSTGELRLQVEFPQGSTPNGALASNTATIDGTNAAQQVSNNVDVTATASDNWTLAKALTFGATVDQDVIYTITIDSPGNNGTLDLQNVVVTDTLPAGAVFISASDGGTESGGVVTWNLGTLAGGGSQALTLTVQYPDASFNPGDSVTNNTDLTGTPLGESQINLHADVTHLLDGPGIGVGNFDKNRSPTTGAAGSSIRYRFEFTNNGNSAYDTLVISDVIPDQIDVTQIRSGRQTGGNPPPAGGVSLAIEYTTDQNASFQTVPGSPFNTLTNSTVDTSTFLGAGEYITELRYTYSSVPVGFRMTDNNTSTGFQATILATDRLGNPVNASDVILNTGSYLAQTTGLTDASGSNNGNVTVIAGNEPRPRLRKTIVNGDPSPPGGTARYQLQLQNLSTATGSLTNPVITDLLPLELSYVDASWFVQTRPSGMPDPIFEQIPNYNGTGRTLLRWSWTGASAFDFDVNTTARIRFDVDIKDGTAAGDLTNEFFMTGFDNPTINTGSCSPRADADDLDGDGNTTETFCWDDIGGLTVSTAAAMESVKLVKGQLDSQFHRFPDSGLTVPGGDLQYRLTVTNVGNVQMTSVAITDILPIVGDTGVIDPQARLSEWTPILTTPVTAPAGVTVFYSIESNPCRDDLGEPDPFPAGCVPGNFSAVPPADITTVRSLRFDFGSIVMDPLDSVELNWAMQAPIGAPTAGEIAWNSFGFVATRVDNGSQLLPAEPIKVGIAVQAPQPAGYGDYVWVDSDAQGDQNEPVGNGVNGVRVELYQDNGDGTPDTATDTFIGFRLTDFDENGDPGYYQFTDLPSGDYFARFVSPAGFSVTVQGPAGSDAGDSDVDPATGLTEVTHLDPGEFDFNWDLGLVPATTASVGNYVWFDRNGDGTQNESTSDGVNGVTVNLLEFGNSTPVQTTTTADDSNGNPGYYQFDGLTPGVNYLIEFVLPSGATFTTQGPTGSSDATDSDPNTGTGQTEIFSLVAGQFDSSWDAGIVLPTGSLSLGDRVWVETDNDSNYDFFGGEQGINGVRIDLYQDSDGSGDFSAGDQFYSTTTTFTSNGPGFYEFTGLPAGDFIVQVHPNNFNAGGPLEGLISTTGNDPAPDPDNDLDDDDNGPDIGSDGIVAAAVSLAVGTEPGGNHNGTVDFGLLQLVSDLGDAPDSYGTDLTDAGGEGVGPSHTVIAALQMGAANDIDADGVPSVAADGDDIGDGNDDEDGVASFPALSSTDGGSTYNLNVNVQNSTGGDANLVGWIDFDGNGTFDSNEAATAVVSTATSGNVPLSFTVPGDITDGASYARFRLTTDAITGANPTGAASDGEVEDYRLTISAPAGGAVDWGDLPDNDDGNSTPGGQSYPTNNTDGGEGIGASHTILASDNPTLGATVDPDIDGAPSALADGDDNADANDDEDGVTLPVFTEGERASISYTVTDPVGNGRLNAWIDWNADGDFDDIGEQIATDVAPSDTAGGANALTVDVPVGAVGGTNLGARFRFSNDIGLGPTGTIGSGEVEDYIIQVNTLLYDLGNRVWLDADGNGVDNGEAGIQNVLLELLDGNGIATGDTTITDATGHYVFTNLPAGDYRVRVAASNFQASGALETLVSTTPDVVTANDDADLDDNGIDDASPASNGITSGVVTLLKAGGDTDLGSELSAGIDGPDLLLGVPIPYPAVGVYGALNGEDNAYSLFVGGDFTVGSGAAEAEGRVFVHGDMIINKTSSYSLGFVGAGTYVVPTDATIAGAPDWLTVGGDINIPDANGRLELIGVLARGNVTHKGALLGAGVVSANSVTQDATLDLNPFDQQFQQLANRSQQWGALADTPGGSIVSGGGAITFTADGSNGNPQTWVFNLSSDVSGGGIAFSGFEPGDTVLINMNKAGSGDTISLSPGFVTPPSADLLEHILWNFPDAETVTIGGFDQIPGSVLVPSRTSTTTMSAPGHNGRFIAGGNVIQAGSGTEFHNQPFRGALPLNESEPSSESGAGLGGSQPDDQSNRTVDFGFQNSGPFIDFGDAPDGYGTNLADGGEGIGPNHVITAGLQLGAAIDDESDGAPSPGADGDDTGDGNDDEDSVASFPALSSTDGGSTYNLNVNVQNSTGSDANLVAWIDFDGNGTFDSNEAATAVVSTATNGNVPLSFTVPGDIADGASYARIRLTTDAITGADPTGAASDGEVEDYPLTITAPAGGAKDLGDAPDSYGTDLTDGGEGIGPNHSIIATLQLGAANDADADGAPSPGADGDDTADGNDDEDSVASFPALSSTDGGSTYNLSVNVQNSTGGDANLVAWIDFDGNGTFDSNEAATAVVSTATNGNVPLSFTVPGDITDGASYARIRLTTDAITAATPTGAASDGEVEDYPLTITAPAGGAKDLGDAPDSYGTDLTDGGEGIGPNHSIIATLQLGAANDADADGAPSVNADGDDSGDGNDDEDSVTDLSGLTANSVSYSVDVNVSNSTGGNANLVGWIDFDRNGRFDADEAATAVVGTGTSGTVPLTFTVPGDAQAGPSYARFRLTTDSIDGNNATGAASNGEVEDYPLTIGVASANSDYGDAPDSYGTTNASNAARHVIAASNNPQLGNGIDAELDGLPSIPANGDDLAASSDEDGLVDPIGELALTQGTAPAVQVVVSNTSGVNATLFGWIDYDGNGQFDNASERASIVVPSSPGASTVTLNFPTVPAGSAANSYARFRFSTDGAAANPTGVASDGEVEDYPVLIAQRLGSIGNYVWIDENSDGEQDAGEPGLANVTVQLLDSGGAIIATQRTDANGGYLFTDLPAAAYEVRVDAGSLPAGLTQTNNPVRDGLDFGNQAQDGVNGGYDILLASGDENLSADFGYNWNPDGDVDGNTGVAALGDRVWIDANGDGVQDPGEPGVAGVLLQLIGAGPDGQFGTVDDVALGNTSTDAAGNYLFDSLPAGAYQVGVDPSNFSAGNPLQGYAQSGDPDHFGTGGGVNDNLTTTPVILAPGDVFLNADFGYQPVTAPSNSIGDTVWFDANANGSFEPSGGDGNALTSGDNEYGIAGVTVALIDAVSGDFIAATTTDENGEYLFSGLPDGSYTMVVTDSDHVLGELAPTFDADGGLDERSTTTLANNDDLNQDFGYAPAGHSENDGLIGDTIYHDVDNNSQPDPGEGIEGVVVELYNDNGSVLLSTTVTDENGQYSFGNLVPGSYRVEVDITTLPPGLSNTVDPDGGLDSVSQVTVGGAEPLVNLDQDFGYRADQPGSIGNLIWLDRNADGNYDPDGEDGQPGTFDDERPIGGVSVDLYHDTNGNGEVDAGEPLLTRTFTSANINAGSFGADGNYRFNDLPANDGAGGGVDYLVQVSDVDQVLGGYWHSLGLVGTNNNSQQEPYAATLTPAQPDDLTADFGYYVDPAALGNRIWRDNDLNGLQSSGDTDIAGAEVTLTITWPNGDQAVLTTVSATDGSYSFGNLLLDEDFDGVGTAATPGVGGGDEPVYVIGVATPAGLEATTIDVNGNANDLEDSDDPAGVIAVTVQGQTDVARRVAATDERPNASYDFGFRPNAGLVSLGNRVWLDDGSGLGTAGDGIQNGSEPGIANVEVRLLDAATLAVLDTRVTDAQGYYLFESIAAGDYLLEVSAANFSGGQALNGLVSTSTFESLPNLDGDANDNGINGDGPANGIRSGVVTLLADTEPTGEDQGTLGNGGVDDDNANLSVDFGFETQGPLSCTVICDVDGDNDVDLTDIRSIFGRRGQFVTPGGANTGDCDRDGLISTNDGRACLAYR